MKISLAIACAALALTTPGAQAEPVPFGCLVTEQARTCDVLVMNDGPIHHGVWTTIRMQVFRAGVEVRCLILTGPEVSDRWAGNAVAGDVIHIELPGSGPIAYVGVGPPAGEGTTGAGTHQPCPVA